ncbi:MAG TPA: TAXI family TRAP transporter solute-binding subunit [Acetobacteraceae bacterium]|nr:TAXI family TRAP transporter solute-binding subunit [Acetobacteraceae bacterium]
MRHLGRCLRGLALAFVLLVPAASWAANPLDPTAAEVAKVNANTVEVISGGVDGTYIRIASDLSSVLDDGDQLRVLAVVGKGSLQNVSDVLYLRGIDIGLVQSDVLAYAKLNHLYPGLEKSLQYISKLYDEEIHVLARPEINAIEDLAGKKVNVDVRGSGTAMTSAVLFQSLNIAAEPTYDNQQTALEKLKNGDIAALVYVTGKPAKLFSGLSADSGLHFLSVPFAERLADTYLPAELDHGAYPALVADKPVDTIAVGSVMAVFAWPPGSERFRRVSRFVDAFFSKFQQFLQPPHHPKWHEVNLAAQVPGWTRFAPAKAALDRLPSIATASSAQQAEFNTFLSQSNIAPTGLTEAQQQALFRNFLDWQQRQRASR